MLTLHIRVRPSASSTRVKAVMADGTFKIDIAAPPEDGKANEELVKFLAEEFGVAVSSAELLSGPTSRKKIVRITRIIT